VLSSASRAQLQGDPTLVNGDATVLPAEDFGYSHANGHWASCIQVIDPITEKKVLFTLELEENEAAVSIAAVPFASQDDETFLVVGTGKNMVMSPRSHSGGFIHIYRLSDSGKSLEFIHKTPVEEPPLALLAFQSRLLAGVGTSLRLYDLGMRQLLRKSQGDVVPNMIVGLTTQGSRIIVSDLSESVICATMVDYETVAGGDKFGNLWLVRCPQKVSDEADEEGSGAHLIHERGYLQGTPNRLQIMIHFFSQDIPTSIHKTQLVAGGKDVLLWSGLNGTLGILVPFVSREDVDFFQSLETHLRTEDAPLAGRDHLIYRSYYVPVKGVIDGDLCERFSSLPADKKAMIAGELDRSVRDVEKRIAEMRTRVAY
jgi:splicing factor 3B subunit 3